jgi:hypothetical protein
MRERKLRSGVNWQGALKQNDVKQKGAKEEQGNETAYGALGDVEQLRRSLLAVCLNDFK